MDVKITFISSTGQERVVSAPVGSSVMHSAVANGVPELLGDCGGDLACATCHVYIDPGKLDELPPISDEEDEMLDTAAAPREPNSRLSCQVELTPSLEGFVVRTPSEQL
jgi:2Fe-2S ferredoxin